MSTREQIEKYSRKAGGRRPVALITGGSSGMGLEYARQLAAAACDVVLVSNQKEALEEQSAALAGEFGINAYYLYADLSESEAAAGLLAWCDSEGLEIDFLILNAGMYFFRELTPELMAGKAETMLQLHVMTNTRLAALFGDRMKKRGYGYVLMVASMAASLPMPGISVYAATKAYLKSFGRSLYFELRPYGVGVTVVCPGAIATPLYGINPSLLKFCVSLGIIKKPAWLVRRAIRAMFRHRRCIAPGFMNIYLPAIIAALPNRFVTWIWKKLV